MNVGFAVRKDIFKNSGGDTIQILKTKENLEKISDIHVDIITDYQDINNNYSIIHIFNMQRQDETLEFISAAQKKNIKTVLSPIYWDLSDGVYVSRYFSIFSYDYLLPFLKPALNNIRKQYMNDEYLKKGKKILQNVSAILPNSIEEANILYTQFKVKNLCYVIPNAVDINENVVNKDIDIKKKHYILEVGRIEPIKNQYKLIESMLKERDIPIVLIGRFSEHYPKYNESVKRMAQKHGNVTFIEQIDHSLLGTYYSNAAVHVLPSFRESPGLVTLEALSNKTNVVVSEKKYCPISTYKFDTYGYVCNPYSNNSIREAVESAYIDSNKKRGICPTNYFDYFSYENAARLTLEAYKKILS